MRAFLWLWRGGLRSSLVAVLGLLTAVSSLAVELGLQARGLGVVVPGLWSTGSIAVARRLICSVACGIFLDQGSNLHLLTWQVGSLPPSHEGSPRVTAFFCIF